MTGLGPRRIIIFALAVLAVAVASASAQQTLEPLSPAEAETLKLNRAVTFKVSGPPDARVAVEVSLSPATEPDGHFVGGEAFVGNAELHSDEFETQYEGAVDAVHFHRFGTYYWHAYRLGCQPGDTSCAQVGPTRTFVIPKPLLGRFSRLSENGFGPIQIGMTEEEAEAASHVELRQQDGGSNDPFACSFLIPRGLSRVSFMTSGGRIVRTAVWARGIATSRGIRVGDSERKVLRRYGRSRIRVTRHAYVRGHYLTYRPRGGTRAIVFETNRGKVQSFRGGRLPEVSYIEGCV